HQADHRARLLALKLDVVLWDEGNAGRRRSDTGGFHGLEHGLISRRFRDDFPVLAIIAQVFATGFENDVHQIVFFGSGLGNDDVALLMEQVSDSACRGHVSAVLAEDVTDFADRAVAVIGVDIEHYRDAAGTIAFEGELFVHRSGKFAGTALDGAFDIVGWHVLALGGQNRRAQARIGIRIATAVLGGNADFLDKSGENLAALCIERALFMLNCGPFGMAGHGSTSFLKNLDGAGFAFRGDHRIASVQTQANTDYSMSPRS